MPSSPSVDKKQSNALDDTLFVTYRYLPTLIPLLITVLALFWVHYTIERQRALVLRQQFHAHAAQLHNKVLERMAGYDEVLRGGAGLFKASKDVSRAEWQRYVEALELDERYKGIQGIGFAAFIARGGLQAHESLIRREGYPDYSVVPSGSREAYSSILYIEPFFGRNRRAFGYDMFSEPVRHAAMVDARDTGDISYSGPVRLIQETDHDIQVGVLAYQAIYDNSQTPNTIEQRRKSLRGWVYIPFRMGDLIEAMLKSQFGACRIEVYDGPVGGIDTAQQLYDSLKSAKQMGALPLMDITAVMSLPLSGRQWSVRYSALPPFEQVHPTTPMWPLLMSTGVIGVLLCVLTWLWINTRQRGQQEANQHKLTLAESEERFRLMVDGVSDYAILMLDEHGLIRSWNAGAQRIKGYAAEDIIGKSFMCFYEQSDIDRGVPQQALASALINGKWTSEGLRVRKDGSKFWASVSISPLHDNDGHLKGFVKVTRDITDRKRGEENMRLATTVFNSTQEGVAITDVDGNVVAINPAFVNITEFTEADMLGQNLRLLSSGKHDRTFFQTLWRDLKTIGAWQSEIWNRRKSGDTFPSWMTVSAVRNPQNEIVNYVAVYTDITRIRHSETLMEHLAHHDALTDLPNRLLLTSRLSHTLERAHRSQSLCAVLFLDLDKFKSVNDTLGHHAGDELLKMAAKRLRQHLRENDTVARLGGDEFVIVLEDLSSPEGAVTVAQGIIERMSQPFRVVHGQESSIGCSIGISLFPHDGADCDTLIQHADAALYRAKEDGRGTYRFYSPPT
jgi:diguanylate cyclase (GGDEF)-like protein/PAS domain S-box-containing protein